MIDPKQFWRRVEAGSGCWIWKGRTLKGYGQYNRWLAHRVAYELKRGPIPPGLELDHLCETPLCVRPDHLETVTRAENMRRRADAQTHCKRGHEFTEENTYHYNGSRHCRACNRHRVAKSHARRVAS